MDLIMGESILMTFGFFKVFDSFGDYNAGKPIYYLGIGKNEYIIFNTYESKNKKISGFDSWVSRYDKISDIGHLKSLSKKKLKLSFDFDEDIELLKRYMPKEKLKQRKNLLGLDYKSLKKHKSTKTQK